MNTREQLNTLLKSHSMREIGRAAGLTHHTVSKFVNGNSITLESFKKIELAVTNLTQLDAEKAACSDGIKAAVRAHSAQVNDLIARLADADLERVALAERCKVQAESLGAYQKQVALLERDQIIYKVACTAAENVCFYHEQKTMDAHHALTIEQMDSLARGSRNKNNWLKGEYDALQDSYDKLQNTCSRLAAECATRHADTLFLQGLRIGLKYTAVFLVLLLIVAAVCWFGGV
jgi:transcriptional regulator with XRE-family HTH domain